MPKRILSGMRPTAKLHLGNLLGALDNWKKFEGEDSFFMIADWHALTTEYASHVSIKENVIELVIDYLAAGLKPDRSTIFLQSLVPEHAELALLLSMITPLAWLERNPTYKDQIREQKGKDLTTHGFLGYPVLQAADILLYKADAVPVGEDQLPHLELAREIARRFNHLYKPVFKEAEAILTKTPKIPGIDGRKMSKSYGNTIPLFGTKDEIHKAVMGILTDSKGESPENVYAIHRLVKDETEIAALYKANKGKYKVVKDALASDIEALVAPMRERRESISDADVIRILKDGAQKAREQAEAKMKIIREKVGVSI